MPANPKYLSTSKWHRFVKITAAIIGGLAASISFHIMLAIYFDRVNIIITSSFSVFIVWAGLFILTFLFRKAWTPWLIYISITALCLAQVYLFQ